MGSLELETPVYILDKRSSAEAKGGTKSETEQPARIVYYYVTFEGQGRANFYVWLFSSLRFR